uniref:Uncharacterized protein n=1 Tax=Cacopsylla melanoneura TaxID=428564 RepID=A0A8D8M2C9_9HEMI
MLMFLTLTAFYLTSFSCILDVQKPKYNDFMAVIWGFFSEKVRFLGGFWSAMGFFCKSHLATLGTTYYTSVEKERVSEGTLKVLCVVCCCFLYSIPYEGKAMNLLRGLETRAADIEGGQL